MKTFEQFLRLAGEDRLPRSGIILGLRMAMAGLKGLEMEDPQKVHDHLLVIVETDRCLPDAVELVTGCRLGNRRLKFKDIGKMAATLVDTAANRAIRVAARESAHQRALEMFPDLDKDEALGKAYCTLSDDDLFTRTSVRVEFAPEDLPGYQAPRVPCAQCGEGIAFAKQIVNGGQTLCRSCAGPGYFEPA